MKNTNLSWYARWLLCALTGASLALACGEDGATIVTDNPNPTLPGNGVGSSGSGGGQSNAGTAGVGGAGTGGSSACVETPIASEDFLNRCSDSACRGFDNQRRLGLYQAGQPLPEVP